MDPFIEACGLWEDFHTGLISEIHRALAAVVPDRYVVRAGERSYVELTTLAELEPQRFRIQPDLAVLSQSLAGEGTAGEWAVDNSASLAMLDSPVEMRALVEVEHREPFLEILEVRPQRRLVTAIEVLSPANKRQGTPGWYQYLRKRQAFMEGLANFVEIDLLREGTRVPMQDSWPNSPYYLLAARRQRAPICRVWPTYSLRPLPKIFVPLTSPDPDVELLLQPMLPAIAERSGYEDDIDYQQFGHVMLSSDETAWLQTQLQNSTVNP